MSRLLARFARSRAGVTPVEYGLIAAFIAVALAAAVPSIRNNVTGLYRDVDHQMVGARKEMH